MDGAGHLKHDPATTAYSGARAFGKRHGSDGFTLGAMTCAEKASAEDVLAAVFERVRHIG